MYNPFKKINSPFIKKVVVIEREIVLRKLPKNYKPRQITEKEINSLPNWKDKMKEWGIK